MNYYGKKIAITGANGFIGSALRWALEKKHAFVHTIDGDIRDPKTFSQARATSPNIMTPSALDYSFDYLFHFAAPSSQVLFKRKPAYCIETTLKGFMNAAKACRRNGIRLIYPSTGILSQERYNEYAMCKKICEDYVAGTDIDALGLRIFATYGPGEAHKRDYASVPYLFARDIVNGRQPVVFGDGSQTRDFIYIDDVVEAILHLAEGCTDPVIDVGSGEPISFNYLLSTLIALSSVDKQAKMYSSVVAPAGYIENTAANVMELHKYYVPSVTLENGLSKIISSLTNGGQNG